MFEFLTERGLDRLSLGQRRQTVMSLLGTPNDTSVNDEPEIVRWLDLECSFSHHFLCFISIRFAPGARIRLPHEFRGIQDEINESLPCLLDKIIQSRIAEVRPLAGLTFEDQSGYSVGPFWTLVTAEDGPYLLSVTASEQEVNGWRQGS